MRLVVERPAIVCRPCPSTKTDVIAVEGRQVLRCRTCRRTWPPYDTSPSPSPAYRTAPPEHEEERPRGGRMVGLGCAVTAPARRSLGAGPAKPIRAAEPENSLRGFLTWPGP